MVEIQPLADHTFYHRNYHPWHTIVPFKRVFSQKKDHLFISGNVVPLKNRRYTYNETLFQSCNLILTRWFFTECSIFVPILKPQQQLLRITLLTLLTYNLFHILGFIFINPQQCFSNGASHFFRTRRSVK